MCYFYFILFMFLEFTALVSVWHAQAEAQPARSGQRSVVRADSALRAVHEGLSFERRETRDRAELRTCTTRGCTTRCPSWSSPRVRVLTNTITRNSKGRSEERDREWQAHSALRWRLATAGDARTRALDLPHLQLYIPKPMAMRYLRTAHGSKL